MTNTFYKILTTTLQPTVNSAVFTDGFISEDSVIECFTTDDAYYPESADQSGNTVTLTFKDHTGPLGVAIVVLNSINSALEITDEPSMAVKKAFSASGAYALQADINVNSNDIMSIFGDIGNLSELETVLKDNLVDAINELKAGIDSKSAVEVTQIQTEGTHIADIGVDGSTVELYAPAGGGGGSTNEYLEDTEIEIGTFYDKTIYRYCHTFPEGTGGIGSSTTLIPDIPNFDYASLDEVLKVEMHLYGSNYGPNLMMNGPCRKYDGKIGIYKWNDYFSSTTGRIFRYVIEYTKVGE